jgi:hypothetical protein
MNNIAEVKCYRFWSDDTSIEKIEINIDEYSFFELDYRIENTWHIIGHKKLNDKWVSDNLSIHGVCGRETLVSFIRKCNSNNKYQKCKVSRFNNLHYYDGFYEELIKLLGAVDYLDNA